MPHKNHADKLAYQKIYRATAESIAYQKEYQKEYTKEHKQIAKLKARENSNVEFACNSGNTWSQKDINLVLEKENGKYKHTLRYLAVELERTINAVSKARALAKIQLTCYY